MTYNTGCDPRWFGLQASTVTVIPSHWYGRILKANYNWKIQLKFKSLRARKKINVCFPWTTTNTASHMSQSHQFLENKINLCVCLLMFNEILSETCRNWEAQRKAFLLGVLFIVTSSFRWHSPSISFYFLPDMLWICKLTDWSFEKQRAEERTMI